jgi:DNA-directed RNA polymerase specialized sigma24 family protein
MSQLDSVEAIVPHLRRFARALTGSQASGDAYVEATLQALVADPSPLTRGSVKIALYRVFLKIWNSVKLNTDAEPEAASPSLSVVDRRLAAITPLPRQAFLLTSVEGFSPEAAAEVLEVSERTLGELLDQAGREMAEQLATKVLIIEDEPLIALDLSDFVRSLGHQVITVARTHLSAVDAVRKEKPGLILADIRLADDSSGLEAVSEILSIIEVPVIFITAFPELLLTGKRPEPTFLITKPFHYPAVKALISQALFFNAKAQRPRVTPPPSKGVNLSL